MFKTHFYCLPGTVQVLIRFVWMILIFGEHTPTDEHIIYYSYKHTRTQL